MRGHEPVMQGIESSRIGHQCIANAPSFARYNPLVATPSLGNVTYSLQQPVKFNHLSERSPMAFHHLRKHSIARATAMAIALLATTLACHAQSAVETVGMGQTYHPLSVHYTQCDGSRWSAQYIGGTRRKTWRHQGVYSPNVIDSDFIEHQEGSKCMHTEVDSVYLDSTGGTFFSTCERDNCARTRTFSQSMSITIDEDRDPLHVQLDINSKSLLTLGLFANPPANTTFRDSLDYIACNGTVWRMSFPHIQQANRSETFIVSHTSVSKPGPSRFDNRIEYRGHDGACKTKVLYSGTNNVFVKFLGPKKEHYTWMMGSPTKGSNSFQGFYVTRE
jgi:hypothetical protein